MTPARQHQRHRAARSRISCLRAAQSAPHLWVQVVQTQM
jgi:hypothetical protein